MLKYNILIYNLKTLKCFVVALVTACMYRADGVDGPQEMERN